MSEWTLLGPVFDCANAELDLRRVAAIYDRPWVAGRPMPQRPLHRLPLLNREITVTERLEVHPLWGNGRLVIKPLPQFLLQPCFWEKHLGCTHPPAPLADHPCACALRRQRALGLLFSIKHKE